VQLCDRRLTIILEADGGVVANDLDEGPVGDALAVGQAAALPDVRAEIGGNPTQAFLDQSRLTDPGSPEQSEEIGLAILDDPAEGVDHELQLAVAADERCAQTRNSPELTRYNRRGPDSAECPQRRRFSLGQNGSVTLVFDGGPGQLLGQRSHDHLAGFGVLLQARGDVHRIADDELAIIAGADNGLAAIDPDPDFQFSFKLLVQLSHRFLHGQPTPNASLGIVIVEPRDAEHDHDRVTDELLDDPAVRFGHLFHTFVKPRHLLSQDFRIGLGAELSGADHVGEEHG